MTTFSISIAPAGCYPQPMSQAPVALTIGGQTYRVRAAASEHELRRLANLIDARLSAVAGPHKSPPPQTLLLVAISLAHDLEREHSLRCKVEREATDALQSLLERLDAAIGNADASIARLLRPTSRHADEI